MGCDMTDRARTLWFVMISHATEWDPSKYWYFMTLEVFVYCDIICQWPYHAYQSGTVPGQVIMLIVTLYVCVCIQWLPKWITIVLYWLMLMKEDLLTEILQQNALLTATADEGKRNYYFTVIWMYICFCHVCHQNKVHAGTFFLFGHIGWNKFKK